MLAPATRFRLAFAATHRVIDWVHRHAARLRTNAKPARTPGLTPANVEVIGVADLADRRHAFEADLASLARRHLQRRKLAFFRHHLARIARRTSDLTATA